MYCKRFYRLSQKGITKHWNVMMLIEIITAGNNKIITQQQKHTMNQSSSN